jgi:hypothetical protein
MVPGGAIDWQGRRACPASDKYWLRLLRFACQSHFLIVDMDRGIQ